MFLSNVALALSVVLTQTLYDDFVSKSNTAFDWSVSPLMVKLASSVPEQKE